MRNKNHLKKIGAACLLSAVLCAGCGRTVSEKPSADAVYAQILNQSGGRQTRDTIQMPEEDNTDILSLESCQINVTGKNKGYLTFTYTGSAEKIILQIIQPDNSRYTYPVRPDTPETISLVSGDGDYRIEVLENTGDNAYITAESEILSVKLENEFSPFLYPNQYTDYTPDSACVALAKTLSDHADTDLTYVKHVYDYVVAAIAYDTELAENIGTNYIPDPDDTLESKKGICFDYASLMTAMLRSQDIPTKLEVGYAGTAYHAWISVYLKETGWIDNIIRFDGKNWSFMDPTVAANQDNGKDLQNLIGDGTTYTVQYHY